MSGKRRFFRLAYSNPPRGEEPRLHQVRDGPAFCELASALSSLGCEYATLIHNYPNHRAGSEQFRFLRSGDLLVMTTRPPLSDDLDDSQADAENREKKVLWRSNSSLEAAILKDVSH